MLLGALDTSNAASTVLDEDNLVSDSNTHLATQQSIKAYADTKPGVGLIIALGG
mgnify:CR=1 FL=1